MNDKEIIIQYLERKGIAKNKFYSETGLSNGFLTKGGTLLIDKLRQILEVYPELGFELFPELKEKYNAELLLEDERSNYGTPRNQLEEKERAIVFLEKSIGYLEKNLYYKEEENNRLQSEVNAMKRINPLSKKNN